MAFGVRVLDTILSDEDGDSVIRNSADFWKPFCAASGWDFSYERVHSKDDLIYFLSQYIEEDVIILSGHGDSHDGWKLSNGDVFNGDIVGFTMAEYNRDKYVILSACSIGENEDLVEQIRDCLSAKAVFAYHVGIEDRFCFLNESILLTMLDHRVNQKGKNYTDSHFIDFAANTLFMKNINTYGARKHPMVMCTKKTYISL